MPCGALLSAKNAYRRLPIHVGSKACKGLVCGGGAPLKRKAPAAAAAAAGAAPESEELSDAEPEMGGGGPSLPSRGTPAQKRRKDGANLESFMPSARQKAKVCRASAPRQQSKQPAAASAAAAPADQACSILLLLLLRPTVLRL
jgi:hypothetical protein